MSINGLMVSRPSGGILYSMVSRGTIVLVHYALCHGNFTEVTQLVLQNIDTETDTRLTYACGEYMYHYVCEGGIIYLCITDDDFERSRAFLFLESIKKRFRQAYGRSILTAKPFAMNTEFSGELAKEMHTYTETSLSLVNLEGNAHLENIGIKELELSNGVTLEQLELESDTESLLMRSHESYKDLIIHQTNRCARCCENHRKLIGFFFFLIIVAVVIGIAVALGACGKKCL